jgi:hypothetical protein
MVELYRVTFLQRTSWHRADSSRHFSGGLHIRINHRLIYLQRLRGMSRPHQNVKCLDRWQSVCTASTDSKSKNTRWEWWKLKNTEHYRLGNRQFSGVFVAIEVFLGRNNTSILNCSFSKMTSYKSKNIILDWIVYCCCARTSIRGHEIPASARCCFALNLQAVSQYPTHCNADVESSQTSMIRQ